MVLKNIIIKKNYEYCVDYLSNKIEKEFDSVKLFFKKQSYYEYLMLKICSHENVNINIFENKLYNLIADILSTEYKYTFYKKAVTARLDDEVLQNILLKTLVGFNQNLDKLSVLVKLNNQKTISIDGIYDFQMSDVKRRWNDILPLANNNLLYFNSFECYTEILKYLMEQMESKYEQVHIYKEDSGYCLKDKFDQKIGINDLLLRNDDDEVKLIISLIGLAPKQIYIHNNPIQEKTYNLISRIFE